MSRIHHPNHLLIIGLDGVPVELVRQYTENGTMPVLGELLRGHSPQAMTVSLPDVSAVSWSGFMTGRDSGYHGIFGFTDLEEHSYRVRFPDSRDLRETPFFMQGNRRSIVVNLPATYPARPFKGILISGFVAPNLQKAVWPQELYPLVKKSGYVVDVDFGQAHKEPERFLSDLYTTLRQRLNLSLHLMRHEKWNLFMFTVTGTDRLHHFFFDAWNRNDHPRHKDFVDYYMELDKVLGELLMEARRHKPLEWLILSDHGFESLVTEVNINPLLREWGYAMPEAADAEGMRLPVSHSHAFALDPGRIYLNTRNRFPSGRVEPREKKRLMDELTTGFCGFHFNNRPVIRAVHRAEEIYGLPLRHRGPDLVLEGMPGFDLKAGFSRQSAFHSDRFRGTHRRDNAFISCSQPGLIPRNPTIFQVRNVIEQMLESRD
ncbi:MAG TPA: hypothetical protein ENN40_02095 [Candidatus Aminicenantes bacterium]|nr:hypothetical protein [Candidatus Aminicenantes bacterium]